MYALCAFATVGGMLFGFDISSMSGKFVPYLIPLTPEVLMLTILDIQVLSVLEVIPITSASQEAAISRVVSHLLWLGVPSAVV